MARYIVEAKWDCDNRSQHINALIENCDGIVDAIQKYLQHGAFEDGRVYTYLGARLISFTLKD